MTNYKYSDFWTRVGDTYASSDPLGAVCWDGAPTWFNRFFAHFQVRAVRRAMLAEFGDERRRGLALDLGCGTGRWTRWLERWWSDPVGVDISRGMLLAADPQHPYLQTDITKLPFPDATFEFASSVTVLLHLPPEAQAAAIRDIARVLKPGATFVMLEMINRVLPREHVFPHPIREWSSMLSEAGFEVRRTEGEAQAPLLRAAFVLAGRMPAKGARSGIDETKRGAAGAPASASAIAGLRGPLLLAARAAVALSYPLEYALMPVLPAGRALNVCIVARKR
ncbi:MAG: class I SAM-dependent methyltransferase [Chloroflexi bacterium]|nr:class I SAM-dependent methyltransferase [Chloroflexota bacterium]